MQKWRTGMGCSSSSTGIWKGKGTVEADGRKTLRAVPTTITPALEIGGRAIGIGLSSGHLRIALAALRQTTGQMAELVETQCC